MLRFLVSIFCLIAVHAHAEISVRDDNGNIVKLEKPAQRVVSLAPHVTELLFAAGGGPKIVAAVEYSDFPEAAKRIPRIGDNREIDIERLIAMKPDLLVVWRHVGFDRQLDQLRRLGIPMFFSEPRRLIDIPDDIVRLGRLLGTDSAAWQTAARLRNRLAGLKARYADESPVRLFYQVWDKPLYTLNGDHIVSDAIRLCGGINIFAKMDIIAPNVTIESVLKEDPEAILGTAENNPAGGGVEMWTHYPALTAVKRGNLLTMNGDLLNRSGPRMIDGTAVLCEKLDLVRQHRKVP
jgi:iron complex transport system substrate-binding protein